MSTVPTDLITHPLPFNLTHFPPILVNRPMDRILLANFSTGFTVLLWIFDRFQSLLNFSTCSGDIPCMNGALVMYRIFVIGEVV